MILELNFKSISLTKFKVIIKLFIKYQRTKILNGKNFKQIYKNFKTLNKSISYKN